MELKEIITDGTQHEKRIADLQAQCAEFSSIVDLMAKISALTSKRDVIEKIKEICLMIFGANQVRYWSSETERNDLPDEITELFASINKYMLMREDNRLCIKIQWEDRVFGIVDAQGFMFPDRMDRILRFTKDIAAICGVAFSNIEKHEQLIKYQRELKYISYHDSLTELFNRKYLNVLLERPVENNQMIVFAFDIDEMKYINDHFGHTEGDKLIQHTAAVLRNCLRETDFLARAGGDEFVAILPQPDRGTAEAVLRRIQEAIEQHNIREEDPNLKISVSIGFAVTEEDEGSLEELLQIADERMQENKMIKSRTLH